MVSFDGFSPSGEGPIYAQLVMYIKRSAVSGAIPDGDELPSRRVVSALLGINPNTVQRAYRILEDEGLCFSRPGAKSRMLLSPERLELLRAELRQDEAARLVRALKQTGIGRERALALIEELWDREDEKDEE